jgi:hypothetical protein
MRLKSCLLITILCTLGITLLVPSHVYADSISPSIYEVILTPNSKTTGKVTFKNESTDIISITPTVSAYDPKTLQLITDEKTVFLKLDKETYTVQPQANLILNYEIIPPVNLKTGTYFNLIILQETNPQGYLNVKNPLGAVGNLSQLVTMHIVEEQTNVPLQITSDFAQVNMEITDAGIPFLKPMSIKYTYQNTTNYVLNPSGEIQVFDSKSSYSPEYYQINKTNKKLYPGDTIEETITVNKWHITDILFGRKIAGRFYNGIDQNTITKELSQNSYYAYLIILVVLVFLVIILLKSIQADRKKK